MARRPVGLGDLAALRDALARDAAERAARAEAERLARAKAAHEADLFRRSIGAVAPLKVAPRVVHARATPEPVATQRRRDEVAALDESLSDDFDPDLLLEIDDQLSWRRDGIGPDVLKKLRRGHWVMQAELDLHGARVDEARAWLAAFLQTALKRQHRCVRVVHGKGLGSVGKQPVLKGKVRSWLRQKDEVLAFCEPPERDGGAGALLVLLRPC